MKPKTPGLRSAFVRNPAAHAERAPAPVKAEHNDPPTIEQFDREHMGVAAKE